jgi:hypothetical protein
MTKDRIVATSINTVIAMWRMDKKRIEIKPPATGKYPAVILIQKNHLNNSYHTYSFAAMGFRSAFDCAAYTLVDTARWRPY